MEETISELAVRSMGRGVVKWSWALAFYSDNTSSSPVDFYSFYFLKMFEKNTNKRKRGRDLPIIEISIVIENQKRDIATFPNEGLSRTERSKQNGAATYSSNVCWTKHWLVTMTTKAGICLHMGLTSIRSIGESWSHVGKMVTVPR